MVRCSLRSFARGCVQTMATAAAFPGAVPAMLSTRHPFLLLSATGTAPRPVMVWIDLAAPAASAAAACRLGALRWTTATAGAGAERGVASKVPKGSSGRVPLHAISDVRLGCAAFATAALPPDQCLSIAFTAVPAPVASTAAAAAATASPVKADAAVDFRGMRCTRHSLDLAVASGGPPLGEWVAALLAHLEQRLGRRLLSLAEHEALSPPIPSTLLDALEGGIEVTLHARAAPASNELRSIRSLLWLNSQRDSFFWSAVPPAAAFAAESDQAGLPLDSISDVFCGTHDPIWRLVQQQAQANAEPAPTDDTVLTIRGSQPRMLSAQGHPTTVELHIQTASAQAQSMLLALIQYANDLADRAQRVQACVVVEVPKSCRKVLPRFFPGSAESSKGSSPAVGSQAAASSSAAAATSASSHAAATASPAQPARRHVADINLSADPLLHSLVHGGVPVTLFLTSHEDGHIEGQDGLLLYAYDASSAHGQLRWSCSNGAAGRANFTDLSGLVLGRSDPIFKHDACAGSEPECCLSIHTLVAGVRAQAGVPPAVVRGFKLHLSTNTAEARTRLVAALEHAIERSPARSAPSSNGSSHTTSPVPASAAASASNAASAAAAAAAFTLPPAAAAKSPSASLKATPMTVAPVAASPSKLPVAATPAAAVVNGTPKPTATPAAVAGKPARARVKIGKPAANGSSAASSAAPAAAGAAAPVPVARKVSSSATASPAVASANGKPALKKKSSVPAAISAAASASSAAASSSSSSSLAVPEPQQMNGAALLPPNASPMPVSSPAQLGSPTSNGHSSASPALQPYTPETAQSAMLQAFLATEGASASFPSPADPVTPPTEVAVAESTGVDGFGLALEPFSATAASSANAAPSAAPALDPVDLMASFMATGQIPAAAAATSSGSDPTKTSAAAPSAALTAPVQRQPSSTAATISTDDVVVSLAPVSSNTIAAAPRTMKAVDTAPSAKGATEPAGSEPTSASSEVAWIELAVVSASAAAKSASAPASTLRSPTDDADEFGSSDDSNSDDDDEGDRMYGRGAPKPQGTSVISPGSVSAARAKLIATGFMPLSPVANPGEGIKLTSKPTRATASETSTVVAAPAPRTTEVPVSVVAVPVVAPAASPASSAAPAPSSTSAAAVPIKPSSAPATAIPTSAVSSQYVPPATLFPAATPSSSNVPVVAATSASAANSAAVVAAPASTASTAATVPAAPSSASSCGPTSTVATSSASTSIASSSAAALTQSAAAAIIPSPGLASLLRTVNPFHRALATLAEGCAFTSLRLSNPQDLQSAIVRDKIFMWLNPHPALEADSAEEPETEGAGALFWCPLVSPRSRQTKVECSARRMDIARLADLFLGRQFGLFVARTELENVDDHLALSFVAMPSVSDAARTESDPPQHLDLLAEDPAQFQNWMQAFNTMLQGEIAEDRSDVNRRASLPLDDAVLGRPARVQLSALASSEEDLHRLVLLAQHWSSLSDNANEGLSSNIALGQWCLARMREGCRAQVVVQGPQGRLQVQRSFLVFHDDESEGTILSSRCLLDEASLLVTPAAASSPVPDSHALAVREMMEIVLGRCAGAWAAFPPSVAHGRSLSFVHLSTSTLDVEFDSVSHLMIWVLGLKYLLLQAADPLTFQPALVSEGRAIPAAAQSILVSCRASIDRACVATHWSQPLDQSAADPTFELLQRGAIFELFSSSGSSISSQTIHLFFSFEDASTDGQFGSLYWNDCLSSAAPASPWIQSPHRRLELDRIATLMHGKLGGAMVEADTFFLAHSQKVLSILGERASSAPACLTLHSDDESLHLVWLRSAASSSINSLDAWLSGLEQLLERAGRCLLLEATVGIEASWRSVGGGLSAESEVETLPFAPAAASSASSASSSTLPSIAPPSLVAHQRAFSFMAPVLTPEFLAAQSLLKRGRRFFLYSQTPGADAAHPIVTRRTVTIYYSRSLPPRGMCDSRSFDLPAGETEFPALWAVDEPLQLLGGPTPSSMLRLDNMRADRCLCLHELTDLFVGIAHAPLWRDPSALAQFGPFRDEACLTVQASCVTDARTHSLATEWNLQAIDDVAGLESWIQALCVVLPVHAQEADVAPMTPSPAPASAAPRAGQNLSVVVTPADSANASIASYPAPALTPNSLLSIGAAFLLFRPAIPGAVHSLHPLRVHLFWMSAAQLGELGVTMTDATVFPVQCKLPPGEAFQGALYWRPLDSAASAIGAPFAPITRADLHADRCMPLHGLTDIYHGRETPLFRAPAQSSIPDVECMSFVASLDSDSDGVEWNLHCLAPGPPSASAPSAAANIVSNFVGGVAALVEKAGKAFSDVDATEAAEEHKSAAKTGSAPATAPTSASTSTVGTPLISSTTATTTSEADRRSRGVSGLLPSPASPTAAHLLSTSTPVAEVLSVLRNPTHVADSALHAVGVTLLHNHCVAVESSASSAPGAMTALIDLGVGRQVVESMLSFPRSQQIQSLGCATILMLAVSADDEIQLAAQRSITAVLAALDNHVVSAAIVEPATGALLNLCLNLRNAEAIGDGGGLESLFSCLRCHPKSTRIVQSALACIASLVLVERNRVHFSGLGGLECVVGMLKKYPASNIDEKDVGVHVFACAALRNLVAHHAATKTALLAAGGVPLVLSSLNRFRRHRRLQLHALGLLWNASACHTPTKTALGYGVPLSLLASMQSHSRDAEVVGLALGVMKHSASVATNRSGMVEAGVIEACVDAQRSHASSALVQRQAASLMTLLADSPARAEEIIRAGGVESTMTSLRASLLHPTVAEGCCGALWMLAKAPPATLRSVSCDALITLADSVLATHSSHAGVQKMAAGMRAAWVGVDKSLKELAAAAASSTPAPTPASAASTASKVLTPRQPQ